MNTAAMSAVKRRKITQWSLLWVVVLTLGLGWKYPIFGFSVPIVMLAGMILGYSRGRYLCGNLCPRGSFFDRIISPLSRRKTIPAFLRNRTFRWMVFAVLMSFMTIRIGANPADWHHWGHVFWSMCLITTGIGVALGLWIHPRAWCSFCPMGTMQSSLGGLKRRLQIDSDRCVECRACEKACPMNLQIVQHKPARTLNDPDCLKCPQCIGACPRHVLSWPEPSSSPAPPASKA